MIPHTANGGRCLLVEVPEDAHGFECYPARGVFPLPLVDYWLGKPESVFDQMDLPEGNWEVVGKVSDLTEIQAIPLVDKNDSGTYKSYDLPVGCDTALESLSTLLSIHGLKPECTLILKQL